MRKLSLTLVALALLVTLVAFGMWLATDRHAYTKFEVVEQVEVEADPDDPLAAAGFFEGEPQTRTEKRDEFHFGLLPTPSGLFDKHMLSVASMAGAAWLIFGGAAIVIEWRRRKGRSAPSS